MFCMKTVSTWNTKCRAFFSNFLVQLTFCSWFFPNFHLFSRLFLHNFNLKIQIFICFCCLLYQFIELRTLFSHHVLWNTKKNVFFRVLNSAMDCFNWNEWWANINIKVECIFYIRHSVEIFVTYTASNFFHAALFTIQFLPWIPFNPILSSIAKKCVSFFLLIVLKSSEKCFLPAGKF